MAKRRVMLLDQESSPWPFFLKEFFSDTCAELSEYHNPADFQHAFSKPSLPDIVWIRQALLSQPLIQRLRVEQQSRPDFRIFQISGTDPSAKADLAYDSSFTEPLIFRDFQRQLTRQLPMPDQIKVLVVDDEPLTVKVLNDYLEVRKNPSFQVRAAVNGTEALKVIEKELPDVMILDIKMPVMNGIELYREIHRRGWNIPTIVHFDAVFGDEVIELHKIGNPAILEKGADESSAADMMSAILKMTYFG